MRFDHSEKNSSLIKRRAAETVVKMGHGRENFKEDTTKEERI